MQTLFDARARQQLTERIAKLTPDIRPSWGKMDAGRMVVHVTDQLRAGLGELACQPKNTPLAHFPLKQLVIYVLPWPKGTPTAPELIARTPGDWQAEVAELRDALERFGTRDPQAPWPDHPAFGRLTGKQWGHLSWRHTDHHLRQFGV
ncbi:MAG TPA: DUF1569 domain-containing protein [Longimicrobium sp.]|nr:DUF1569 domain-containing protein [Longimicrobium sp.]